MMKRTIAGLLVFVLMLGMFPITAHALDVNEAWLNVNFLGSMSKQLVLLGEEDQIFVPMSWLESFGAYVADADGEVLHFTPWDQKEQKNFAQRIFVDKENSYFSICIYAEEDLAKQIGGKKARCKYDSSYFPIYQTNFSESFSYDGDFWAPIEEVLPLMNLQAGVSDSGDLCLMNIPMTLFEALYRHEDKMEELLFDSDQIWGKDFMVVTGWVISTGMDCRVDRLFYNWGKGNDYEYLFENYLTDNEAYLSLFGGGSTPVLDDIFELAKAGEIINPIYSAWSDSVDVACLVECLKGFEGAGDNPILKGVVGVTGNGVDALVSLAQYVDIYANQVEDHRLMLDAVYHYNKKQTKNWPSRAAADTISGLYDTDAVDSMKVFEETAWELLQKMSENEFKDMFMSKLGPWFIAIELTKVFAADACKYINDSALIDLVDNTVRYARSVYEERLSSAKYSAKNLTDLRLCAIMSLVASRHAFKTYWTDLRQDDIDAIDEILKDLYLAGVWRDFGAEDSWKTLKQQYDSSLDKLYVVRKLPTNLSKVEQAIVLATMQDSSLQGVKWTLNDADSDGSDELLIAVNEPSHHPGEVQLLLDTDSMVFSSHTPAINSQISEFTILEGSSGWCLKHGSSSLSSGGENYYRWNGSTWKLDSGIEWSEEEDENGKLVRHEKIFYDGKLEKEADLPIDEMEHLDFDWPVWYYPEYDCPELSEFVLAGDGEQLQQELQDYMNLRDGVFATDTIDLNGDGVDEQVYALYQPCKPWFDHAEGLTTGSEPWLTLDEEYVTVVAAEIVDAGLRVRTDRLYIGHISESSLKYLKDCYHLDQNYLDINAFIYYYQPEGKLFLSIAEYEPEFDTEYSESTETYDPSEFSLAAVLAGTMEMMISEYPYAGDMSYGVSYIGGEASEFMFDYDGSLDMLRVNHQNGGSLPIIGDVTTDITLQELIDTLPFASNWQGPHEVYGFTDTPEWYEHYCTWVNPLDGKSWDVTVGTENGSTDEAVSFIAFSPA